LKRKIVSGLMLTLLAISVLTLVFYIQPVKSDWTWTETIYIRADGSIEPDTAPISSVDNITYKLTENIVGVVLEWSMYASIVIERNNTVVDGAGYTIQGTGSGTGIDLSGRSNVTIKNMKIKSFWRGVNLFSLLSNHNSIIGNNITNNNYGIWLESSLNHSIVGNNITNNDAGVWVIQSSSNNNITENNITAHSGYGILLGEECSNNSVVRNNIAKNSYGIVLGPLSCYNNIVENSIITNNEDGIWLTEGSNYNTIIGNNIKGNNRNGIGLRWSSNNSIYHNNFIDNTVQVYIESTGYPNVWDDGYPSGGNCWSDYTSVDADHDGIGDTPYVIDENNQDNYPLVSQWGLEEVPEEDSEEEIPLWMQWWFYAIVAVVVVAVAGTVIFLKKRKPPTAISPPPEGTETPME